MLLPARAIVDVMPLMESAAGCRHERVVDAAIKMARY